MDDILEIVHVVGGVEYPQLTDEMEIIDDE